MEEKTGEVWLTLVHLENMDNNYYTSGIHLF